MGYIISFVLALLVGFYMVYLSLKSQSFGILFTFIGILCFAYAIFIGCVYGAKPSAGDEYAEYMKAKCECEMLSSETVLTIQTVESFKSDIDHINKRIAKSKKYKDAFYIQGFYNKETAELTPISYDTVKITISIK